MAPHDPIKITEKIKNLLALSKSSNVNEAAEALAQATKLMTKYQIEICEEFDAATQKWSFQAVGGTDAIYHSNRISLWEQTLMSKAASFFGGTIVRWASAKWGFSNAGKLAKEDDTKFIYVGTKEDAGFCKLVFWDISRRTRDIYNKQKRALNLTSLDSFGYGVATTIMTRMEEERNKMMQAQITERGLVSYNKKGAEFDSFYTKWANENGVTERANNRNFNINWDDVMTGRKIGSDMALPVFNSTVE